MAVEFKETTFGVLQQRSDELWGAVYDSCLKEVKFGVAPRWRLNEAYLYSIRDIALQTGDFESVTRCEDMICDLRNRSDYSHLSRKMARKKRIYGVQSSNSLTGVKNG